MFAFYATPGTISRDITKDKVEIMMEEAGPILIWNATKTPDSDQLSFEKVSGGLWKGTPTSHDLELKYVISTVENEVEPEIFHNH